MKKQAIPKILPVLLFVLIISCGLQMTNVTKANPFFNLPIVDPVSGTNPPSIELISPQNGTVYSPSDVVCLSFNVSKPELATAFKTGITLINYTIDDEQMVEVYSIYTSNEDAPGRQNFAYATNLTLPEGNHMLTIHAGGVVYPNNTSIFDISSNSTVHFTVGASSTTENNPAVPAEALCAITILSAAVIIVVAVLVVKRRNR